MIKTSGTYDNRPITIKQYLSSNTSFATIESGTTNGMVTNCIDCSATHVTCKKKGTVVKDGVTMKNDSSDNSSILMTLNQDEEIRVLFCLTKDDGKQWFYVQHKTGVIGYIEAESLEVTE